MRMWAVPPHLLCVRHLIAEHNEMHGFTDAIRRGQKIQGYIDHGLVEIHNIKPRHDALVAEMKIRSYYHDDLNNEARWRGVEFWTEGQVDVAKSLAVLSERCEVCRQKIAHYKPPKDHTEPSPAPRIKHRSFKGKTRSRKSDA